jgi:glucoamylase
MGRGIRCILALGLCIGVSASADPWMKNQADTSLRYLLKNISAPGTAAGSVIASPSRGEPMEADYFYFWVRDAALVMSTVVELYRTETDLAKKADYATRLEDYVRFSRKNQTTANPSDRLPSGRLGEPKFNVDGSAYNAAWGRPQNDGPALRAIALIQLANLWIAEGRVKEVRAKLYDGRLPTTSVIKEDLEFVAHHWKDSSFDIWEEISGQHFYTRLVHRRAMVEGAKLADKLGDAGAADYYRQQIKPLEAAIETHWDSRKGLILPTLDRDQGIDYKVSDIDMAVLLAVMHAQGADGYYSLRDSRVLASMEKYIRRFNVIYPINAKGFGAVAIGRYPEDVYDGYTTGGTGNPWFLTTAAIAEIHYTVAKQLAASTAPFVRDGLNYEFLDAVGAPTRADYRGFDKSDLVRRIHERGDAFLRRACFHTLPDGHISEQINRNTGFMQGARDLTWSYASYLTAFWQR